MLYSRTRTTWGTDVTNESSNPAGELELDAQNRAEQLDRRVDSLMDGDQFSGGPRVVGRSEPWRAVLRKVLQVAPTRATVLLLGESGTGKEVVARLIHRASAAAHAPFIAVNCAALQDSLLESELFGHERGAFTDANSAKPGQIELASGGVLFLDEIGEMSAAAQAKLLRVLQEREFQRVGGTRLLKANVRVIAATNRDLQEAVERRAFREDLYYRLQVFDITIPPLRERIDDVPLLAAAILEEVGRSLGRAPDTLTPSALAVLQAYSWPGNVRQLRNVLERAAILCDDTRITPFHLDLPPRTSASPTVAAPAFVCDLMTLERDTIRRVLLETDWNKSQAASRLGLSRSQLYVRLRRHSLHRRHALHTSDTSHRLES
jgi:transcriptional regulator with GAF, ATPase, and Fis domain